MTPPVPTMTQRHFEFIARTIRDLPEMASGGVRHVDIAEHFARALAEANPRFKADVFMAACGTVDTAEIEAELLADQPIKRTYRDVTIRVTEIASGHVLITAPAALVAPRSHKRLGNVTYVAWSAMSCQDFASRTHRVEIVCPECGKSDAIGHLKSGIVVCAAHSVGIDAGRHES